MSKPYITCPYCGNHLDIGERCECRDKITLVDTTATGKEANQPATENPQKPVLVPGA